MNKRKHLIRVGKPAHPAHNAENVVIGGVNTDLGIARDRGGGEGELKGSVIDTRHITGSRWLMLFGFQPKRVNVNTSLGDVGVVLVRLDKIEVSAHALRETIVTVELELGGEDRVETSVFGGPLYVVTGSSTSRAGVAVGGGVSDGDGLHN